MKRKEKAAVDEFVALVGGKTWEPVRIVLFVILQTPHYKSRQI